MHASCSDLVLVLLGDPAALYCTQCRLCGRQAMMRLGEEINGGVVWISPGYSIPTGFCSRVRYTWTHVRLQRSSAKMELPFSAEGLGDLVALDALEKPSGYLEDAWKTRKLSFRPPSRK